MIKKTTLFLDLDGVINSYLDVFSGIVEDYFLFDLNNKYRMVFNQSCIANSYKVDLLRNFVLQNNIEVVLISDWTIRGVDSLSYDKIGDFLGITICGAAHNLETPNRTTAVLNYVTIHNIDNFIILDDTKNLYPDIKHPYYCNKEGFSILDKLVNPHGRYGINEEHIEIMTKMLKK
mgnify:CR=1 FL=1|tara:strand:+ start:844 stop:1371 length:528 start_codon:yes stop_codon:yes gene_type:complete